MLSYTGRRQSFQDLTNASDATTLALGDRLMNQSEKRILTARDWPFLEKLDTSLVTVASQAAYTLPQRVSKPKSIYVTVSSVRYVPQEITSREQWDRQNVMAYTSDFPVYYYIFAGQVHLWPTPATSSNTIGLIYRNTPKDLTIADYTTGTISTTSGSTITGSGTTWTAGMVGQYLRITDGSAALQGDGYWYEIATRVSNTSVTLTRPYAGTALAAASATYTIGQMSLLPEGYEDLPVFDAVKQYFATVQPITEKFTLYDGMFKDLMKQMTNDQGDKSSSPVLDYGIGSPRFTNPNLTITL